MGALDYVEPDDVVDETEADPVAFNAQVLDNIRNFPRGVVGYVQNTTTATLGGIADLSGVTVTFTAPAGRLYKITAHVVFTVTSGEIAVLYITDGSNNQIQLAVVGLQDAGTLSYASAVVTAAPSAGSVTYKVRVSGVGSASAASSRPNVLIVEDIGAA